MKLYLVYTDKYDWDEYDSCAVLAKNEEEAIELCTTAGNKCFCHVIYQPLFGKRTKDNLHVIEIDTKQKGIICASFNAG